jgi:hypothetical protein
MASLIEGVKELPIFLIDFTVDAFSIGSSFGGCEVACVVSCAETPAITG